MSKSASKPATAKPATAKPATAKPAPSGLASTVAQLVQATQVNTTATQVNTTATQVNTTATQAKVPASHAVLASINASANKGNGALPTSWQAYGAYVVTITPKGMAAKAMHGRMAEKAKNGPCPFLLALFNGQGQTLVSVWPGHIAGHGQQGRGNGGYTAAQALSYYVTSPTGKGGGMAWFTLTPPATSAA